MSECERWRERDAGARVPEWHAAGVWGGKRRCERDARAARTGCPDGRHRPVLKVAAGVDDDPMADDNAGDRGDLDVRVTGNRSRS